MAIPDKYGVDKKINKIQGLTMFENGGEGSGNFGHSGRPGKVGGSGSGTGTSKVVEKQKKNIEKAKGINDEIEERIGQKIKEGEQYSALDDADNDRYKFFHGEDGTEYTYDKENKSITKTNPKTGDQEVVEKKDKKSEPRKTVFDDPAYEAIIAEQATFRGIGGGLPIKEIARRFDMEPEDVERDIDDYPVLKELLKKQSRA